MTTPVHVPGDPVDAYEDAFEALWQQTCLGRFSVAEVKEQLLALRERFGGSAPGPLPELPGRLREG